MERFHLELPNMDIEELHVLYSGMRRLILSARLQGGVVEKFMVDLCSKVGTQIMQTLLKGASIEVTEVESDKRCRLSITIRDCAFARFMDANFSHEERAYDWLYDAAYDWLVSCYNAADYTIKWTDKTVVEFDTRSEAVELV